MKHVFVETNFIVDVARPFSSPDALELFSRARADGDVRLHVPWVAVAEAKRTLDRIIREDLGFTASMLQYVVREFRDAKINAEEKMVVDALSKRAAASRKAAIQAIASDVDAIVAGFDIIEPSKPVLDKLMSLFSVKSLKPFDEMVLAAVLTKASDLYRAGERDVWFCNLNTKDFDPASRPTLAAEYASCGLQFWPSFALPREPAGENEERQE